MDLHILSMKVGQIYYAIIFTYKNQKWAWNAEFGSDAGFHKNPSILEMGANEHSISN